MSSYCECCEFDAPNHSRYLKHLGTKKHAKRYLEAIKHMENPNQNIVFSQSSKERVQEKRNKDTEKTDIKEIQNRILERVQEKRNRILEILQEKRNKQKEERIRKRCQKKKLDEKVPDNKQNNDFDENVQETEQNNEMEENVQESRDFVFLDTQLLDLYKTISTPFNPTFSWITWLIVSITAFFHPFSKKTEEKGLTGNE